MSYRPYAAIIAAAQSSNSTIKADLKNDSGSNIAILMPVTIDASGKIKTIDVSVENDAIKAAGVTEVAINDGATGTVVLAGRILNITTAYNHGDYIYVSKTGGLTNILPEEGSGGFGANDFVIRLGVIVRNNDTPANKDLLVRVEIVGRI